MVRKNNKSSRKGFDSKYVIAFVFVLALFLSVVNVFNPTGMAVKNIEDSESFMSSDLIQNTRDGDGTGDFKIYVVSDCKGNIEIAYSYIYLGNSEENDAHIYIKLNDEVLDDNSFKRPRVETFDYNYRFDKSNYEKYSFSIEGGDNIGVGDELSLSYKNGDHTIMITDVVITCGGIEKGSLCWDSDGGKNYDEAGYAIDGSIGNKLTTEYYDACVGDYVYEKYCFDGMVETEKSKCDIECKSGACGDGIECTDTDGGNEPFVKGTVTYGENVQVDECLTSGYLNEYVCGSDDRVTAVGTNCLGGCENGVCKSDPTDCTDTDGGDDNFLKGVMTVGNLEKADECEGENYIDEYFCTSAGDDFESDRDLCDLGCVDGACVCEIGDCADGYGCVDGVCVFWGFGEDVFCKDSDGGVDHYKKGTIVNPLSTTWTFTEYCGIRTGSGLEVVDSCKDEEGCVLYEISCADTEGTWRSHDYECPNGCENGACIVEEVEEEDTDGSKIYWTGESITKNIDVGGTDVEVTLKGVTALSTADLEINGVSYTNQSAETYFVIGGKILYLKSVSYYGTNNAAIVLEFRDYLSINWVGDSVPVIVNVDGTELEFVLDGVMSSGKATIRIDDLYYHIISVDDNKYMIIDGIPIYIKSVIYYGVNNAAVALEFKSANLETRSEIEYKLIEGVKIEEKNTDCSSGDKRCLNNDLQVCANSTFTTSETCENGCNPVDFECYDKSRDDLQKIIDQLQAAVAGIVDGITFWD
jgi:hypothetical protein